MKKKTILLFIILSSFYAFSLAFTRTTFVLFLYDNGFSRFESNFIFSVFNISVIICEPLSAPIAEIFSRKASFIIGGILKVLTAVLFIYASSMPQFVIAEILSGLAAAFISGALTAWAVDKLKEEGEWKEGYKIFATVSRFRSIFTIVGGLFGAYLGEVNLTVPWIANGLSFAILCVVALYLMDTRKYEKNFDLKALHLEVKNNRKEIYATALEGYKIAIKDRLIMILIISSFISSFALISLQMFRLPLIKQEFEISQIVLGYIWVIIESARLLGTFFVGKYYSKFKMPIQGIIYLPFFSALLLASAYFYTGTLLMIVCFYLFEFFEPFYNCLKEDIINTRIEHTGRVTLLSMENILSKVGRILGLLGIGFLADAVNIGFAWYSASIIFSMTALMYYLVFLLEKKERKLSFSS